MARAPKNLTSIPTTGFGSQSNHKGGRFYRKDGSPNVKRRGIPLFDRLSWFHTMLALSRWQFLLVLTSGYILVNLGFALVYYTIGIDQLSGIKADSHWQSFAQAFFFSVQTFTTVGYGHISPSSILTSSVAALEAFLGLLSFALATGLFYGRFSKPRALLQLSEFAVIAPYKNANALMLRTTPYKNNHLMDAEVKLTIGMKEKIDGEIKNVFYPLAIEFEKINALILNWTIVHPITEESPIYGMNAEDLKNANAEILVYLKAYDEGFSNSVVARTSYTANEIVEGAKFKPMYYTTESVTVLELDKLNHFDKVKLNETTPVVSE
jgi:inward rectifier potassium channel